MKTWRWLTVLMGLGVFSGLTLQPAAAQSVPLTNSGKSTLQSSPEGSDGNVQTPEFDPALDLSDDGTGTTATSDWRITETSSAWNRPTRDCAAETASCWR